MRLGSSLIPLLKKGWYADINLSTIAFGEEVLRDAEYLNRLPTPCLSDRRPHPGRSASADRFC